MNSISVNRICEITNGSILTDGLKITPADAGTTEV